MMSNCAQSYISLTQASFSANVPIRHLLAARLRALSHLLERALLFYQSYEMVFRIVVACYPL